MSLFPTRAIFLQLGPLAIHWYGIMYLLAFLCAWWLLPILARKKGIALTQEDVSEILFAAILGVILGGRFGYVLFYAPAYFASHPFEIFAVWKGGMSSHGGFIGVTAAMMIVWRTLRDRVTFWQLGDLLVVPVAIGLAFGRLGNFINLELFGPMTTLPWGIALPGENFLRHPTPLYAMLKDLIITGICFWSLLRSKRDGVTLGVFLVLYGVFRFLIEYVRVETASGFDVVGTHLTRGQVLTVPIIFLGVIIVLYRMRSEKIFNDQ